MAERRFTVLGPYEVPTGGPARYKWIDDESLEYFWGRRPKIARRRGCYVFALRTGQGLKPIYVGRATRLTFAKECFTADKINKVHKGIRGRSGTLLLFLLAYETTRGALNQRVITAVED